MEYEVDDKFKIENERAKVLEVFEENEEYKLLIVNEEEEMEYTHFISEDELLENDWKKDNRIKVEDYYKN